MAELGASVIAFLSLASVIGPLHKAVSSLKEAPHEAIFFRNKLASLRSVVDALKCLREGIPADVFSNRLTATLEDVQKPLQEDIAHLSILLTRVGNSQTSLRGRVRWSWKSEELKRLCGRLDDYRLLLTTLLLFLQSEYLPLQHKLLTRTFAATTNLEHLTASIHNTLQRGQFPDPGAFNLPPSYFAVNGSAPNIDSFVSQLQTNLECLSRQQKTHIDSFSAQMDMTANMLAGLARNDTQHLECTWEGPKMRRKSTKRFQYHLYFGTVVLAWGSLRRRRKRSLDADLSDLPDNTSSAYAASVEFLPASWLSERNVIGGWSLTCDQRGSPSFHPHLSFPVTVADDAEVMRYATSDNLTGLRDLFSSRKASVTDRTSAGWTPLHMAAAAGHVDSCKYLLAHGANVTSAGHVGINPLHIAAVYGHLDVIKVLVDNDADPEADNHHSFNTIFEVLHSPFISDPALKANIIFWILQQEHFIIDINGQDHQGDSILGWFVQHYPRGVKWLVDHKAKVNMRARDGSTPLHKAAASGSLETVQLLINNGADVSIIENDGSTALVRAAERGYFGIVEYLTVQRMETPFSDGELLVNTAYKPVQLLCEQGMPGPSDVVNQIIKMCSSSFANEQLKSTEIWYAAQQGYWSVVSKLQEAGVDPYRKNEYGYRALVRLVYQQDLQRVNELIQSGSQSNQVDDDLGLSLTRAAAAGHVAVVYHLLSLTTPEFFDNALGSKALVAAATHGRLAIVKIVAQSVPQQFWYKALVRAAENGHLEVVNLFLDRGIHPTRLSTGGDTAIVRAARYGHVEVVNRLLEAGADPNQHGWFGYSALVRAAYNNHLEVVDCLLCAGAIPDLPENCGDRAMVRAVRQGHTRVVERLRQAGAQPIDDDGHEKQDGPSKALMKAAIYNNKDVLVQLLQEGADPNTVEMDGNTPISRASENGHLNIVTLLLASGAPPHAVSKKAASPLEKAAEAGHLDIVQTLLHSYHKIPLAEQRRAMIKASERGHADIIAFLVENGVDLQSQQLATVSAGRAHFYVLDRWMKYVLGDKQKSDFEKPPLPNTRENESKYSVYPPTWGYDGSLVAKFRWPPRIFFYSDLTSSTMRQFCSSILLKLAYVLKLLKESVILLGALVALLLGLCMLGFDSVLRTSIH